jgi:hypothetical protein
MSKPKSQKISRKKIILMIGIAAVCTFLLKRDTAQLKA